MKNLKLAIILLITCILCLTGCGIPLSSAAINPKGDTVETRFLTPSGFERTEAADDSYAYFLRHQKLLPDGSHVRLYNGGYKWNQGVCAAVFALDTGNRDLQQCADSVLRLRCEYLYAMRRYDAISFHLTNGFLLPYAKYREGYRLFVNGNNTWLDKTEEPDDSYGAFADYLRDLFTYAGTLSMSRECTALEEKNIQTGDIFIHGGTPGHCIFVADVCKNKAGETCFLLAQGSTPAQQIQVLRNAAHDDAWYRLSELKYPFNTPEYTFTEKCLMRLPQ